MRKSQERPTYYPPPTVEQLFEQSTERFFSLGSKPLSNAKHVIQSNNLTSVKYDFLYWEKIILTHIVNDLQHIMVTNRSQFAYVFRVNMAKLSEHIKTIEEELAEVNNKIRSNEAIPDMLPDALFEQRKDLDEKLAVAREEYNRISMLNILEAQKKEGLIKEDFIHRFNIYGTLTLTWDYNRLDKSPKQKNRINIVKALQRLNKQRLAVVDGQYVLDENEMNKAVATKEEFSEGTFLSWSRIIKKDGNKKIEFEISHYVLKFLCNCLKGYTKYNYDTMLCLHSTYTQRIYENLCKWKLSSGKVWLITIQDFKNLLKLNRFDTYENIFELKRKVLQVAQEELRDKYDKGLADLYFTYQLLKAQKGGRLVASSIKFYIWDKTNDAGAEKADNIPLPNTIRLENVFTDFLREMFQKRDNQGTIIDNTEYQHIMTTFIINLSPKEQDNLRVWVGEMIYQRKIKKEQRKAYFLTYVERKYKYKPLK